MNIIEARILRENDQLHLSFCGVQVPCPNHLVQKVNAHRSDIGYIGIRPENITLCNSESDCLEVEVSGVEKTGREEVVYSFAGSSTFAFISSSAKITAGERVFIKPDLSSAHFFKQI